MRGKTHATICVPIQVIWPTYERGINYHGGVFVLAEAALDAEEESETGDELLIACEGACHIIAQGG